MKLGIVLAAGAAFGASHVGVLRRLREENIIPDILVGTSSGAMVAGLYATGNIENFEKFVASRELEYALLDFNSLRNKNDNAGFIAGNKFLEFLKKITNNKNFEDLNIKTAFNAVDINTQEHVVLDSGNLADAIRASTSLPLIFKPHKIGDRYLTDGGVYDQLPIEIAKSMGADIVIAVTFSRNIINEKYVERDNIKIYSYEIIKAKTNNAEEVSQEIPYLANYLINDKIGKKFMEYLNIKDNKLEKALDLFRKSEHDIQFKDADIIINPDLSTFSSFYIHKIKEMYEEGYKKTDSMIKDIKNVLNIIKFH